MMRSRSSVVALVMLACGVATVAQAQIVDRPLQPPQRPNWGVTVGITPTWSTPAWGRVVFNGPLDDASFSGRDLRVGVVRGRPLGFEYGISLVRTTLDKDVFFVTSPLNPRVTYSDIADVTITAGQAHVLIPFKTIGRRAQIGALLGAGFGILPDVTMQQRIEGPPFYAACPNGTPGSGPALTDPPPGGGFIGVDGVCVPVPAGARAFVGETRLADRFRSQTFWPVLKAQVAADVLITTPLKLRFTAGFNYPGAQWFGVDLVYLVRARRS